MMSETQKKSSTDSENVATPKRRWISKGLEAVGDKRYPSDSINDNTEATSS